MITGRLEGFEILRRVLDGDNYMEFQYKYYYLDYESLCPSFDIWSLIFYYCRQEMWGDNETK